MLMNCTAPKWLSNSKIETRNLISLKIIPILYKTDIYKYINNYSLRR